VNSKMLWMNIMNCDWYGWIGLIKFCYVL